jgi:hypothetical protein
MPMGRVFVGKIGNRIDKSPNRGDYVHTHGFNVRVSIHESIRREISHDG